MAASNTTTAAFIYKKRYSDKQSEDFARRGHPVINIFTRKPGLIVGTGFAYSQKYGNPQGVSALFSKAQANVTASKGVQLTATVKTKYGVITLDGVSMAKARGNKAAFLNLVTMETDGILEEMGDALAFEAHRDGQGFRGQRDSASGDVVTLTEASDARNFKVGMTVLASANADGSSPRTGTTTITSVDEDAGTIGLDVSDITSFADDDYLFREGDEDATLEGFEAHNPLTAPSSGDDFRGVDRSVHVNLLAGGRLNDTATPIEENAALLAAKIRRASKRMMNLLLIDPLNFYEVQRRLNAKITYDGGGNKATYGFEGFDIATPGGTVRVISDPDAPNNRGRLMNSNVPQHLHLDGWVHIIRDGDLKPAMRSTDEDGIEIRARSMGNIVMPDTAALGCFAI